MTGSSKTTRRVLLILGMHRSGTSAITRIVNLLGAGIGGSLVPAGQDNPSGFWEPAKVVKINDDLLRGLGRTWYDMRDMPSDWLKTAAGLEALKRAKAFIQRDMADGLLWAIKDPRLSLTAPVWIKALKTSGFEVDCVFIVRDPREVVDSLHHRNGWPHSPLYLMWVQYVLEAEAATRECRRTMVTYDQILSNWRTSIERMANDLHLTWPVAANEAAAAIDAFVDRGQRHHHAVGGRSNDAVEMPALVRSLYAACQEIAEGRQGWGWGAIASVRADFRKVAELYAKHVDTLLTERWNAESRAETAESTLAERGSMERLFEQTVQQSHNEIEAGVARLGQDVAALAQQVQATNTEQNARWIEQASAIAGVRTIFQQSHEAFGARMGLLEQNLSDAVRQTQLSAGELDGRILRHQESLQSVEARLQRQYELLNTVSLRLEQIAGDRLADKVSALTERVDAMQGAEIQALRRAVQHGDAQLAGVLGSTSWRLTRPLRWFSVHVLRRPPGNQ